MRRLYSLLLYLMMPLILLYLLLRSVRAADYRKRLGERFGFIQAPNRSGGILVHAASMGEVNAAIGLIRALQNQYPDDAFYVTTFTPTGSSRVQELLGDSCFHVYLPFDLPGAVRRFLQRLQPRLVIILETEIWPNLYAQAAENGIPLMISNARISDHSVDSYLRFHRLISETLSRVDCISAQSEQDAERLIRIGAPEARVRVTGNLKFDLHLPPSLAEQGEVLRASWGTHRTVLLAGSTHEGEDPIILKVFKSLLETHPDSLLILVPRHPERFARSAALVRSAGLELARRSEGLSCSPATQCFLIDTMGELMLFYAACDIAFVGGSIDPVGGHNPLEPAALGKPVIVGPYTFNFADIIKQLLQANAAIQVPNEEALERSLRELLDDPDRRDAMGQAGISLVKTGQGAVQRTLDLVDKTLTAAVD